MSILTRVEVLKSSEQSVRLYVSPGEIQKRQHPFKTASNRRVDRRSSILTRARSLEDLGAQRTLVREHRRASKATTLIVKIQQVYV